MKTLDLLLFNNYTDAWYNRIIKFFTGSKWNHVGILVHGSDIQELHSSFNTNQKHIDPTKWYLWESGREGCKDSEDNVKKWGVQLSPLDRKLRVYNGEIAYRSTLVTPENFKEKIKELHAKVHSIEYDFDLVHFIETWLGISLGDGQRTDTFFCSAFCGYIYSSLGLLPKDIDWSILQPCFFASDKQKWLGEIHTLKVLDLI